MKKKLLAVLLVLAMTVAFMVPAMAAGETATATLDKNNNLTITVKSGNTVVAEDTFTNAYIKNGSGTYIVGAFSVAVEYNGNGVKKVSIVANATPPTGGGSTGGGSTGGGSPAAGNKIYLKGSGGSNEDFRGWTNVFYLGGTDSNTLEYQNWHLVIGGNKDLANSITAMQLTFTNGEVFNWAHADKFSTNGGGNNPGWVIVAPLDWELINGKDQVVSFFIITGADPQFNISGYGRFENPYVTIEKLWDDGEGNISGEAPEDVDAVFDIYKYDGVDADGNPICGDLVVDGAVPGVKYKVLPGTYVIVERDKDGYEKQEPQVITVKTNDNKTFTFINVPDTKTPQGGLGFVKTVGGVDISAWLLDYTDAEIEEILKGITFELYALENEDDDLGDTPFMTWKAWDLDDFGNYENKFGFSSEVAFGDVPVGWYVIVEVLSGKAAELFEEHDSVKVYVSETGVSGLGIGIFDRDAFYVISYDLTGIRSINYPGLNGGGEIFYIGVKNVTTDSRFFGDEYISFCANGGSKRFAGDNDLDCEGYLVASSVNDAKFLSAFNFIEDEFGPLGENRLITQVVIWALLGAIDVDKPEFDATYLTDAEKADVLDVLAAVEAGYIGEGKVVDAVYLLCEKETHTFEFCQPQIVPIYHGYEFDNTEIKIVKGSIAVLVEIDGEEPWEEYEPVYEELGNSTDTLVSLSGNAFGNGHTWVAVDVAAATDGVLRFQIADSSPSNRPVNYFYNVSIEDGKLTVYFDDNLISANVGAYVVNDPKDFPGNAPSHHGQSVTVDLPAGYGSTVYLYFHNQGGIKWLGTTIVGWNLIDSGVAPKDYIGELTLTVTGPDGYSDVLTADYPDDISLNGELWTLTDLVLGDYTLVLSGDGFDPQTETLTVTKDDPDVAVTFDGITVTFPTKIIPPEAG